MKTMLCCVQGISVFLVTLVLSSRTDLLQEISAQLMSCPTIRNGALVGAQDKCNGAIYLWSESMPLSEDGIKEIREAAADFGIRLTVLHGSDVLARVRGKKLDNRDDSASILASAIADAGGLAHFPSLIVYRAGHVSGPAVLGFKTAETYHALLAARVNAQDVRNDSQNELAVRLSAAKPAGRIVRDFTIDGEPSAYFRYVANHSSVALTMNQHIALLNIDSGDISKAPGYIDFIPSPDGRLFVTPARERRGLTFFSESQLFSSTQTQADPGPLLIDSSMRDQYPSVGRLSSKNDLRSDSIVYRVLTSWNERAVFRDYLVRPFEGTDRLDVRPTRDRIVTCPELSISIPVLSRDGRGLAARDEAVGTTKLFQLSDDGECTETLDLRLSTGKIAWSPDGRHIAFSISSGTVRDPAGFRLPERQLVSGVYVMDRRTGLIVRLAGSEKLGLLVFPDFIDADHLVFLTELSRSRSTLRLVCCFT